MQLTLALAQCSHPSNGDVVGLVRAWASEAKMRGADLVAFPESLMTPYELPREQFAEAAEPLGGSFTQGVDAVARELGIWIVYTVNETNPDGGLPYNTAVITDASGERRASYRKTHLFDVGPHRESAKMSAGDKIFEPLETPFGALGLGICYDLRFPELARKQALAGCELLIYPAAWVTGPGKVDQWQTLLRARAIENGIFVAGICRSDKGYVGQSLIVSPTGAILACAGEKDELVLAKIDLSEVAATQAAIPSLAHRRPELY